MPAAAQSGWTEPRCYEFDHAYFDHPDGGGRAPTPLVRFEPDSIHALAPQGRRRLIPVVDPPAPDRNPPLETLGPGQLWGYWRPLAGDSVEVSWFSGFHGPLFHLAIRGDTLRGTVIHRTDILIRDSVTGKPVQPAPVAAVGWRVPCAGRTGAARDE